MHTTATADQRFATSGVDGISPFLTEEFPEYAKFAKDKGVNPKKVYVGIDFVNFNFNRRTALKPQLEEPKPIYQSYLFSLESLRISLRTIIKSSSNNRFYDQDFQGSVFDNAPKYKPGFSDTRTNEKCDFFQVSDYRQIREIFPNAEIIGYVPPISPWMVFNHSYALGILDCQLQGVYETAKIFDTIYDFSYPSEITIRTDNTYDGNHYYPEVYDQIAKIIEGEKSSFGIPINQYTLNEYQQFYRSQLKEFLLKKCEGEEW